MAEMSTLNGYEIVDAKARDHIKNNGVSLHPISGEEKLYSAYGINREEFPYVFFWTNDGWHMSGPDNWALFLVFSKSVRHTLSSDGRAYTIYFEHSWWNAGWHLTRDISNPLEISDIIDLVLEIYPPGNLLYKEGVDMCSPAGSGVDGTSILYANNVDTYLKNIPKHVAHDLTALTYGYIDSVSRERSIIDRSINKYKSDTVTAIGAYTFYKCEQLTSVDCPSVKKISNMAFKYCQALETVNLPEVTSIDGADAFSYCDSLTELDMPKITYLQNAAVNWCSALTRVNMPELETIDGHGFTYCKNISEINVPKLKTITGGFLSGNETLTRLELPSVVEFKGLYTSMLYSMTKLQTLSLSGLTAFTSSSYFCEQCGSLVTVEVPNLKTISGSKRLFRNCTSLENLRFPSLISITNSSSLFENSGLKRIDFGNVTTISGCSTSSSAHLLRGCNSLRAVILRSTTLINLNSEFSYYISSSGNTNFYIYVPNSALSNYKQLHSSYQNYFRAIEDYSDVCAEDWTPDMGFGTE